MKNAVLITKICLFFCLVTKVAFTDVPAASNTGVFLSPASFFNTSKTSNQTSAKNSMELPPMENREITNIIVHVNTRHDPYKHAVKNIEKTMQWEKNAHVYEHVVPWAYSNLKHKNTQVPWDDNAKYIIPNLKGNSFVLTGGGKSFCHFLAFETLLGQIQNNGLTHAEVHFPFDSIYASYYFPGDEEMSNLLLNEELKYDQPRIFKKDIARLQEFQDYFDIMSKKGFNFTLHFSDGSTKTVINNTSSGAVRIDLYMWETLDKMDQGVTKMEQEPKSTEFSYNFAQDRISNAIAHVRDYIYLHENAFLAYVFKSTSLKGQSTILTETAKQYLDILKDINISSFFDSENKESLLLRIGEKSYRIEVDSIQTEKDLNIFILNLAQNILLAQIKLPKEESPLIQESFAKFFLEGFTRDDQILTGGSYGELQPDFIFNDITPLNILIAPLDMDSIEIEGNELSEFFKTHFPSRRENVTELPSLQNESSGDFTEADKALNLMRVAA